MDNVPTLSKATYQIFIFSRIATPHLSWQIMLTHQMYNVACNMDVHEGSRSKSHRRYAMIYLFTLCSCEGDSSIFKKMPLIVWVKDFSKEVCDAWITIFSMNLWILICVLSLERDNVLKGMLVL